MENTETDGSQNAESSQSKVGLERERSLFKMILLASLISASVSIGSIYYYDKHVVQKFVVMDIADYTLSQKKLYVEGKVTLDQVQKNIEAVKKKIDSLSVNNNVILHKEAVIAGGEEIVLGDENGTTEEQANKK